MSLSMFLSYLIQADPEVTDYVLNEMIVSPREPTKDTGHIEFIQKPLPEIYEDEICPTCKSKLIITEGCNMCIECGFSSTVYQGNSDILYFFKHK